MSKVIEIVLSGGLKTWIDEADAGLVLKHHWHVSRTGTRKRPYVKTSMKVEGKKKNVYLHRFILDAPNGSCVDHINDDPLDNRRANLRLCTNRQNSANRSATIKSRTGIKGVYYRQFDKPWYAALKIAGKQYSAGGYKTRAEAVEAFEALAREHHGEYAYRQAQTPTPIFPIDAVLSTAGMSAGLLS